MGSGWIDQVRRLYEDDRQRLYTYALSLVGDSDVAEDAIQTAFIGLLRGGCVPRDIRPYVFRSVRNAIIDVHRRRRTREDAPLEATSDSEVLCHPVRDRSVRQCLEHLGDTESEIVVLKVVAGLTFQEIGHVCEASSNTVASRYRRALGKMRALLEAEP